MSGGGVVNDDRILSAEEVARFTAGTSPGWGQRIVASHEALRARLADEIEACAGQIARAEMAEARLARSEEERARVEANLSARLADTEAERDGAQREREFFFAKAQIALIRRRDAEARAERAEAAHDALRVVLADTVRAHEAITARFRAGTPKPPPKWAFTAMVAARAALASVDEKKEPSNG